MAKHFTILAVLVALGGSAAATALTDEEAALQSDDQCVMAGGGTDCALNALQLKKVKASITNDKPDISVKVTQEFNRSLMIDQVFIMDLWGNLSVLDVQVNHTMQRVANASGQEVIWNRKSLVEVDESEEEQDEDEIGSPRAVSGRRRGSDFPPRARYILRELSYVQKEMDAVWKMITKISRMDYGIRNTIMANPDGPKKAGALLQGVPSSVSNATSPEDLLAKKFSFKDDFELYKKYNNIVTQILDAQNKTEELQADVISTKDQAERWMAR